MTRAMTRVANRIGVGLYRSLDGRLSSGSKDVHVLMITTPGRRTGRPRSTCVRYLETPDGLLVWGSGSGSPRDPDWFENLRAAGRATVQVRADRFEVRARELVGAEREVVWREKILAEAPEVAKFARKAGRTIPVAVLVPVTRPAKTEGRADHSVWIGAKPAQVWDVYADPARIPEWQTGSPVVEEIRGAGEPGTTYVVRRGPLAARTVVLESDPPRRQVSRTSAFHGLGFTAVSTLEPVDPGTLLRIVVRTAWPRGLGLVGRVLVVAMLNSRQAGEELARLTALVERAQS